MTSPDPAPRPSSALTPGQQGQPAPGAGQIEFKARLLLLAILVIFIGVVGYLFYARGAFEPTHRLVLLADDSEGVTVGMDMTFSGFPLGRVTKLELTPDGRARILVDVPRKNAAWLRSSSVFTVERSLIGGVRIRAYSGIMEDPPLENDAERDLLRGDAFGELQRLAQPVRDLLENLVGITQSMRGSQGALRFLFGNEADAKRVVTLFERSNVLLENLNRQVFGVEGTAGTASAAGEPTPGLIKETTAAIQELKVLLSQSRESIVKLNALLDDGKAIASNARDATQDLDQLRSEVDRNMRKIDTLLDDISRKWPFAKEREIRLP
jgi:phospholipid/cholesterol/gamma-HCH transport system substrate-binding protein